jgi:DNA-binding transcriptional regulator/RsmH inhibitor MraZ
MQKKRSKSYQGKERLTFTPTPNKTSETHSDDWHTVQSALVGIGPITAQLDNFRVRIPGRLWQRAALFKGPFIICLWPSGNLRVLPRFLWPEFVQSVAVDPSGEGSTAVLKELIQRTAVEIKADARQRWTIPSQLAFLAKLGTETNQIVISFNGVSVEIWDGKLWEAKIQSEIMQWRQPNFFSRGVPVSPSASQ